MDKKITLKEAAIFENITYQNMLMRIKRKPKDYSITKLRNKDGGKPHVYIAISSLSPEAQRKYKESMALEAASKMEPQEKAWYMDVDPHWYMEKYPEHYKEASAIAEEIESYASGRLKMRAGEFSSYLSQKYGKDTRTAARYIKNFYDATQAARLQELKTGVDHGYFKILAVARKPREGINFPSITEEVKAFIENTMYNKLFVQNRNPITNLYDDLKEEAGKKGWKIPSYDTVLRYANHIRETDGGETSTLLADGVRAWKNIWMQKMPRDVCSLKSLAHVQTDGHTFDCFVRVKRADGHWEAVRPVLVTMLDTKSRVSLGHVVCEHPNAQIVKQCIINMIYPKKNEELPYGVPETLLTDRGKEFTAETLTGVNRKTTKYKLEFDEDTGGFFKNIGIECVDQSIEYQPWIKAQIERFHSTIATKFSKRQPGYTGTLTGKYTDAKVEKDIRGMLERGELPTMEEFAVQYEKWLVNYYHTHVHRGLKDQGEPDPRPIEVFRGSDKYYKPAPPFGYSVSLLMKSMQRTVGTFGIQITFSGKTLHYHHPMLQKGQRVLIRYMPDDLSKIFVYNLDEKLLCEAITSELLEIKSSFSGDGDIGEDAVAEHVKDQRRQLKAARETIRRRQMPYEERLSLEDAGKKNIMPELSEERENTVAMPKSSRYIKEGQADGETEEPVRMDYVESMFNYYRNMEKEA